jgi:tRNA threonylcarbamoyladenosine biosynthesis protein TsaB
MNRLLLIHTALDTAYTGISTAEGEVIAWRSSPEQRDHAAFLHPAIEALLLESDMRAADLEGVAVVNGPGSYTGLRVGMSAAKGFCYALGKPLITVDTLEWMTKGVAGDPEALRCPMIDARRLEVFTALYDGEGVCRMQPKALVLEPGCFDEELKAGRLLFFGDGAAKWQGMADHPNAVFTETSSGIGELAALAARAFLMGRFADLATAEPFYVKAFHSTSPR